MLLILFFFRSAFVPFPRAPLPAPESLLCALRLPAQAPIHPRSPAAGRSTALRSPRRREHPGLSKTRQGGRFIVLGNGAPRSLHPFPPSPLTLAAAVPQAAAAPRPTTRGRPPTAPDGRGAGLRPGGEGGREPPGEQKGAPRGPGGGDSQRGQPRSTLCAPCRAEPGPEPGQRRPLLSCAAAGSRRQVRRGSARLGLAWLGSARPLPRGGRQATPMGGEGSRRAAPGCWAQGSRYMPASGLPGVSVRV